MNTREKYRKLLMGLATLLLLVLLTGLFTLTWYRGYAYTEAMEGAFYQRGHYAVIALYVVFTCVFGKALGAFRAGSIRIIESSYTQILCLLMTNAVTYLELCLIGKWRFLANVRPLLLMTAVQAVVIIVWVFATRRWYVRMYPPRKLLLIHGAYDPHDLIRKFTSRAELYSIQETISIELGWDAVIEKVNGYNSILLMDIPATIRNELMKHCFANNIRCYCVPKISDIMIKSAKEVNLFDTSLLLFRNMGLSVEQRMVKRVFDVVFSCFAIAISSPFMLIIAAAIKLYDGGPVFFTQDRLTRDGKVFKLYKFRSMRVEPANSEYCMTRKNDDRITPVGKIIRNIHFDELPQILNILKGDMSFVGPRPECPHLAEEYRETVAEFPFRLKVKAGLTGYAQVYGKYNTTPYDKLKLDLIYIQNYSFLLDLKLLILTVKILFQKDNTEGIEAWQTNAAKSNLIDEPDGEAREEAQEVN